MCSETNCTIHLIELDSFVKSLFKCLHECALHTLPKLRVSSSGVPGWNHSAWHLKDKANFWYNVWNSTGSPSSGVLFQIKKSSKSRYKYEVRCLKRHEFHIRRKRLASALARSRTRDFWQEVKRIHKPKYPSGSVSSIDGIQDAHGIANTFASKVSSYLNTHDPHCRDVLLSSLSSTISKVDTASFSISIECVCSAFSKLKLSKSDGSLVSDHVLPVIAEPLSVLFTAMIRHSFMPKLFRDCTLVPIPKSGKDPNFSDSYRAIALVPTLSKALDWCLLLQYPDQFSTSDLQFGFKRFMSTSLCTGTVKNVAYRYVRNGSPVFGCLLDASKAFDLVQHDILFTVYLNVIYFRSSSLFC